MPLVLHDTLQGKKVAFTPRNPDRVTLYVCGPTVYNFAHIGNARPVVVFDVLFRMLRRLYGDDAVVYARNITDVDDRINQSAIDQNLPIRAITDRFANIYNEDMAALGALAPTLQPRATEHIPAMVGQIGRLIQAGAAYQAEGHVLFRVSAFEDYGKLSGRALDDMIAGARVEVAPYKEEPADFVLWKPSKPGEPSWESPWGPGRPGWHIECSAMIESELGLPIDIHGGGHDLIFPHHENEIAQGRCATAGGPYAHYWVHNGFLDFSGEKMSKSLGNVVLVHELIDQHPGEVLRWALLKGHYRSPLDWTESLLEQSRKELDYLYGVLRRTRHLTRALEGEALGATERALEPLLDDLNTPAAMSRLHALARQSEHGQGDASALMELTILSSVLGVLQQDPDAWFEHGADGDLRQKVDALIEARDLARQAKDWAEADRIRAELDGLNVLVMDAPGGATWRMKER